MLASGDEEVVRGRGTPDKHPTVSPLPSGRVAFRVEHVPTGLGSRGRLSCSVSPKGVK